jgi:hypothetical protein
MTSFEDHERSLEEIKALFFYTMYLWTVALVSPAVISDCDFLVLFFFFYLGVFSCILSVYLGWCFLMYTFCIPRVPYSFNDISITCQKNIVCLPVR